MKAEMLTKKLLKNLDGWNCQIWQNHAVLVLQSTCSCGGWGSKQWTLLNAVQVLRDSQPQGSNLCSLISVHYPIGQQVALQYAFLSLFEFPPKSSVILTESDDHLLLVSLIITTSLKASESANHLRLLAFTDLIGPFHCTLFSHRRWWSRIRAPRRNWCMLPMVNLSEWRSEEAFDK